MVEPISAGQVQWNDTGQARINIRDLAEWNDLLHLTLLQTPICMRVVSFAAPILTERIRIAELAASFNIGGVYFPYLIVSDTLSADAFMNRLDQLLETMAPGSNGDWGWIVGVWVAKTS